MTSAGPSDSPARPAPVSDPLAFDQDRAFALLKQQCDFGPRVPNTVAHAKCQDLIVNDLRPNVDQVLTQDFVYPDHNRNVNLHLSNIIGVINPTAAHKILLCAHWDTRPTADNDFTPSNRNKPIPGADDGASGVAVLLELARAFHAQRPKTGVILAFWDGEDWGPDEAHMYLGAVYYAKHPVPIKPDKLILIDMIGQKDLVVPKEQFSQQRYPDLVDEVFKDAAALGYQTEFPMRDGEAISDDQLPLSNSGIPCIDLIDFNYASWHTLDDTPDKCSPQSLQAVGRTLEKFVYDQVP